ncbi:TolC family protein [Hasllibacter halocynthiae]|uniref:TolC family protein n=1 Tax=Hasllibacter halocynthiae TaxID=595589 RepID=UPI001304CFBB|nr:TolC family protein [Hasllibacter halocynthiae]
MTGARAARRGRTLAPAAAAVILGACSLPAPDGLEARLIARTEGLTPLVAAEGDDARAVVRTGLSLSPEVRTAAGEVAAAADAIRIQRAARFPALGLSIGGGVGDAASRAAGAELRGRQLLVDFGRTGRAVTASDMDMRIGYVTFQEAVDEAIVEILVAYDAVRANVRLLEVREDQVAAMETLQDRIAERTAIGAAPRSDLLETRIRVRAARFEARDAELALAEARDRLAVLTGQSRGGTVPAIRPESCAAPDDAGDVLVARLRLAKADLALADAEAARLPSLSVEPVARRTEGDGRMRMGLDVSVDSDLLRGGALSAAADAALAEREAAEAAVAAARRETVLRTRGRLRDIAAAEQRIALLQSQIDLLGEARGIYRDQYLELGTRRIAELLDNEEAFYDRQAQLVELRSELAADLLGCAASEDRLRSVVGVEGTTLYDLPLSGPA